MLIRSIALLASLLAHAGVASAGFGDLLDKLKESVPAGPTRNEPAAALTGSEIAGGLKQALEQGVRHAVEQLGQPGGFLANARVRIPMPEKLQWIDSALRRVGQEQLADEFVESMNRAAEQAVPEVASVFGDAIRDMTLDDARAILGGPDDAATEYFRTRSSATLAERMQPIIAEATGEAGVTSRYKAMVSKAGRFSGLLGTDAVDLDAYVTQKAMDGLFLMIAEQEKQIRENPLQRSTELLQKVFGATSR